MSEIVSVYKELNKGRFGKIILSLILIIAVALCSISYWEYKKSENKNKKASWLFGLVTTDPVDTIKTQEKTNNPTIENATNPVVINKIPTVENKEKITEKTNQQSVGEPQKNDHGIISTPSQNNATNNDSEQQETVYLNGNAKQRFLDLFEEMTIRRNIKDITKTFIYLTLTKTSNGSKLFPELSKVLTNKGVRVLTTSSYPIYEAEGIKFTVLSGHIRIIIGTVNLQDLQFSIQ